MTNINEQFGAFLEEGARERMIDAMLADLKKQTAKDGKGLGYHAGDISRQYNVGMTGREIEKLYIDRYGDPDKKKPSEQRDKVRKGLMKKFGFRTEEGGAGERGTPKLTKKYKKDTPSQPIDEE